MDSNNIKNYLAFDNNILCYYSLINMRLKLSLKSY